MSQACHCACWRAVSHRCVVTQGRVASLCRDTRPCRRPLPVTIQNLYLNPSPCHACTAPSVARAATRVAALRAVSQPWRAVSRPKVAPPQARYNLFCIATQGPPNSRYKLCITASSPGQAECALRVVSQASSAVSRARPALSWLCPAVSHPPPGAPRPACLDSLLCACSACCVPAQPAVCLLSLLFATIQPVVL